MISTDLIPIQEQLKRIEEKLDGKTTNRFLDINAVTKLTSCSASTIRRAVVRGQLKCSKRIGKLLFLESDVMRWLQYNK